MSSIDMLCPHCGAPLSFPLQDAGMTGPCYRCGQQITVAQPPPAAAAPMAQEIVVTCQACGTQSGFDPSLVGQSGPCRGCGATITVQAGAPPPQAMAPAPPMDGPPPLFEIAPNPAQEKATNKLQKELGKLGGQVQLVGVKVMQIGDRVSTNEAVGEALKARFLFGGKMRTDTVQACKLVAEDGDFFLVIPWSGSNMLAHEYASLIPGSLPTCLYVTRGLMGSWGTGVWEGPTGEDDVYAQLARDVPALNDGIEWNWEQGNLKMKLDWGLQAVPVVPGVTLHCMHTAKQGILQNKLGIQWYLERKRAFAQFLAQQAPHNGPVDPIWFREPNATLFAEDIIPIEMISDGENAQVHAFVSPDPGKGVDPAQAQQLQQQAQAVLDTSGDVSQKINAAAKLLLSGAYAEAEQAYRTVAEQHPERRGDCFSQIGAAKFFLQQYAEAIQWYEAALQEGADPRMMQDNIQEAREALAKASGSSDLLR